MTDKTLTLKDAAADKTIELPVLEGTMGPASVDIKPLFKGLGYFTYDSGFASTSSTKSDITFIDGQKGTLLYRGYPIEQLAERSTFMEVAFLLLYGDLPKPGELDSFRHDITHHTMVNERVYRFFQGFHHDAHPMSMLVSTVGALASFYHDALDPDDAEQRNLTAIRMIAKIPTLAAACYRYNVGWPMVYPKNELGYCERFLDMMFSVPAEEYELNPVAAKALNLLFILHADHEQNASTSTVRLVGSTGANPYACVASGIAALWGPAHGGANEAVLNMLDKIGSVDNVDKYIKKAKDKDDSFRLMGFGHRVYKNYDPRATIIREMCHEVLEDLGVEDPRLDLAMKLEKIALEDDYFVQRKLYPNVDFYSGIIYKALGIPKSMFTVMFAIGRTVGWMSHWLEQHESPETRIGRPRQIYTGATQRDYVAVGQR